MASENIIGKFNQHFDWNTTTGNKADNTKNITKDIIISKKENIYPLTLEDAKELSKHQDAVFIFMSPNDISKLEQDLINLKKLEK